MPVTVRPAKHQAREWTAKPATSDITLLRASCSAEFGMGGPGQCKEVIQSSFNDLANINVCPSSNGFVGAAFAAYSKHHHLSIRPEDVWFAILSQLSFYINAHAEELRSLFVAHKGQKEIEVTAVGNIQTVDVGKLAVALTHEMDKHLVDSDLREWIMPNFTTTTATDTMVAAVIMMGSMQAYFSYGMSMYCGIPSVTLLGEKADWVEIGRRIDRLPRFGKEPEQFSLLLGPVLDYFIRSFDNAEDPEVVEFWSKIAHKYSNFSGPSYLSGWITAFCFWSSEGRLLFREPRSNAGGDVYGEQGCDIDGTIYHRIDTQDIPEAYVSVPVTVNDNGHVFQTRMVAGLVGIAVSSSGEKLDKSPISRPNVWVEAEPRRPTIEWTFPVLPARADASAWTFVAPAVADSSFTPVSPAGAEVSSFTPVSRWEALASSFTPVSPAGANTSFTPVSPAGAYASSSPVQEPKMEEVVPSVGNVTGLDSIQPVAGWWMYELWG